MPEYLIRIWEKTNGAEIGGVISKKLLCKRLYRAQLLCAICLFALVVLATGLPRSGAKIVSGCAALALVIPFLLCGAVRRRCELDESETERLAQFERFFHMVCDRLDVGASELIALGFECHFWPAVEARLESLGKPKDRLEHCTTALFFHGIAVTDHAARTGVARRLEERASASAICG